MDTSAPLTLCCFVCRRAEEIDPASYVESPCPECGLPRVLSGGGREGSIVWYYFMRTRCPHCRRVFFPGEARQSAWDALDCPYCLRRLWTPALTWAEIGPDD